MQAKAVLNVKLHHGLEGIQIQTISGFWTIALVLLPSNSLRGPVLNQPLCEDMALRV